MRRIPHYLPLILAALLVFTACQASAKQLFKIGSLAPPGSVWVQQFDLFAKEVTEKTGNEVTFRVYPGGSMGDDQAMLRKMRLGQLHGGGFTMTGISTFIPDFRVFSIPFIYTDYAEVDFVKTGLLPILKKQFQEKGLELVAMTEVGFIYAMSTKPLHTLQDLQQSTNWSPTGDPISLEYMQALGITPIQLSIPDVLSSLQSGLVETVYNSLYGAIVLQWFTKAHYIVDLPYGYAYGAFALDSKQFAKLTEQQQTVIAAAAAKYFPVLLAETRKSNDESRAVMLAQGSEFITINEETKHALEEGRDKALHTIIPNSLSQDIYDQAVKLLNEYRKSQATAKPQ
jgi:TRAP-type C4-dicarboxylate transport system substrate-binding protein